MAKPTGPREMFDLWQKMVNPGAVPSQSFFPLLDVKEVEKKIAEFEAVEHWLKANLNMLQLTIKALEYQRAMLKPGERVRAAMDERDDGAADAANPAMWAWNMMAEAGKKASDAATDMMKPPKPGKPAGRSKKR
jgi:hypothetical protein